MDILTSARQQTAFKHICRKNAMKIQNSNLRCLLL